MLAKTKSKKDSTRNNSTSNGDSPNGAAPQDPTPARFELLGPWQIVPFRYQPRVSFDPAELQEMVDDVGTIDEETGEARGVLQPVLVRPDRDWTVEPGKLNGKPGWFARNTRWYQGQGQSRTYVRPEAYTEANFYATEAEARSAILERYELVYGERRWRAALLARLAIIPAMVRNLSDVQALEIAIAENEKRQDVNAIESALSYARLRELGVKQTEIGQRIGKSQPAIANALRLLELPEAVQQLIRAGSLSESHGKALARFKAFPAAVEWLAAHVVKNEVTVRELEKGVPFPWDMERQGLIKRISQWDTAFDWKTICPQCPIGAHFKDDRQGSGFCFAPAEYEKKAAEARAAAQEKARRELERAQAKAARQGDKKATERLAKLSGGAQDEGGAGCLDVKSLAGGSYIELDRGYGGHGQVSGCDRNCACRAKALGRDGKTLINICVDPARRNALVAEHTKAQQKVRKAKFAEYESALDDVAEHDDLVDLLDSAPVRRRLAVIAAKAFGSINAATRKRMLKEAAENTELRALLAKSQWETKDEEAWRVFSAYPPVALINFLGRAVAQHELLEALSIKTDRVPKTQFMLGIEPASAAADDEEEADDDEADAEVPDAEAVSATAPPLPEGPQSLD